MAHQNTVGGAKAIFVFPVGKEGAQMGSLNTETAVLRLFQEINFWIQRKLAVPFPRQPVGAVALSCFSAGARFLDAVLRGPKNPDFHDRLLRHIFILDGVFASPTGAAETSTFCKAMLAWHRGGQNKRTFRVYTQSGVWFNELVGKLQGEVLTPGPTKGSKEAQSPSGTLLLNPSSYWQQLNKTLDYFDVHQLIPGNFMEHAMTKSDFT